jgi:hypothetical protein
MPGVHHGTPAYLYRSLPERKGYWGYTCKHLPLGVGSMTSLCFVLLLFSSCNPFFPAYYKIQQQEIIG